MGRPKNYDLARLLSDDGTIILQMYGGEGIYALGTKEESQIANAILIAQAPDTAARLDSALAMNKELVEALDYLETVLSQESEEVWEMKLLRIRAVLARAQERKEAM